MFYSKDRAAELLKQIQFSNSTFSQIESLTGVTLASSSSGGVGYFSVKSYGDAPGIILVEDCIFEYCTGAKQGGVFYLDLNTIHITLENVSFLYNFASSGNSGSDIFCGKTDCMIQSAINRDNTCSTSEYSILRNSVNGDNPINPDFIPLCTTLTNPCDADTPGTCKDECVRFLQLFLFLFYLDMMMYAIMNVLLDMLQMKIKNANLFARSQTQVWKICACLVYKT
jgi:hypothetical protein